MSTSELYERIRFRGQPVAHPDAVVTRGNARFTVLTPRLIRLEWSESGKFEDRCTYAFPTRYSASPPAFAVQDEVGALLVDTGALVVQYAMENEETTADGKFNAENLAITFTLNGETVTWRPGMPNPQNLRGTRRTLDNCDGDAKLDEGLLSRAGWSLFDDSKNVIFEDDGWVGPRPDWEVQDWYFFGYGHDYKAAIADYVQFGGEAPLVPRYILGGWWSRYWDYSEQDFRDLVAEFEKYDVPLDVFVIDMDWHTPDSWTGYTWNRELFPDPPAFLHWLHEKGLRVTLNLHPADGIHPHEEVYPEFAVAMGIDPESAEPVKFQIADKDFVRHYFELIHHPMEDDGVDFWWMDWQQGEISEVKGLDPLPWINHLHFNDIKRKNTRPMLYSRWGGLGNQRYYIGFSGDTYVTWDSLQFQPYLTATASNVAYGWWSHDIGGHMGGATEPELYARWVQFGALSPILRLHATKDPRAERRPWAYPEPVYEAAKAAFHLRYRLVPYLYTQARIASDTSIPLCRPMYYESPEVEDAYLPRYQYYLGDHVIAAPIVFPADPDTGLAHTDVWLPEGTWIAYDTLEQYEGPGWVRLLGDLNRMPMLVKAGTILSLAADFVSKSEAVITSGTTDAQPKDKLELVIFPGTGSFRLYEDDGITEAYRAGQSEWTEITTRQPDARTWTVTIAPVEGHCDALPSERGYEVHLMGMNPPTKIKVNGTTTSQWTYDPQSLKTTLHLPKQTKQQATEVTVIAETSIVALGEAHNWAHITEDIACLLGVTCALGNDIDTLLHEDDIATRESAAYADTVVRRGGPFASVFPYTIPYEAAQQLGHIIIGAPTDGTPYEATLTFRRHHGGNTEVTTHTIPASTVSHIIPTPFAFDGQAQSTSWEVEVTLTWHNATWTTHYKSQSTFPTLYALQGVIYNREIQPLTLAEVIDENGRLNPNLAWEDFSQQPETMRNLMEKHAVRFFRYGDYGERLRAGEPLAAYVAATVVSPTEREAIFKFMAPEPTMIYLNGEAIPVAEQPIDADTPAFFRPPRQTVPVQLQGGENTLVVSLEAPEGNPWWWFFGGMFATPDGEFITDLEFKTKL
ncbi:MAG: DUF5110 domain-containing protein [Anaerolineae bacterium]|nr:DUF5110 domain-containing protein [Anaerolineae bacterium]